ncbi:MAG TPA: DNA mismatch repair protein MutS [Kofleriaceae bacterium]|nr:DNA mismatch repair protein MutS [Kofleriaceae bacterium]
MSARSPAETPLMRQYLDVKDRYPDAIVFFRLGDFYEMFFEDAVLGARLLDLTLTTRDKGKDDAVPMCGVPHHAARVYIAKLTELGHKVVLCEQTEDPKLAKGLVKREVVRIVTPGVVLDDDVLEPKLPRYLAALVPGARRARPKAKPARKPEPATAAATAAPIAAPDEDGLIGLAYLDATTGELAATELPAAAVLDELVRVAPREVLASADLLADPEAGPLAPIRARYRVPWNVAAVPDDDGARAELGAILGRDADDAALAVRAAATVVAYARATQPTGALPVVRLQLYQPADAVVLDEAAIANLELTETLIGKRKQGSLLDIIDETATAPGGRLLRRWLLYPLVDVAQIRRRQDTVAWLVERPALCEAIRRALSRLPDLERLAGKAMLGVATPRDLGRVRDGLAALPELIDLVRSGADPLDELPALIDCDTGGLAACVQPALAMLASRLAAALVDEPPSLLKDGQVIRAGYDKVVDESRKLADGGKDEILAIEEREQKASGIASLKVRYNRVFGYYIEITKTHLAKVPARYIRKQTVATGERFVTSELAELERRVLTAEDTLAAREAELFRAEVAKVAERAREVAAAGAALAVLDAASALAQVAASRGYCRPLVDDGLVLDIVDGRHPVIEALLPAATFVPNDVRLDPAAEQLVLITGPNMAGKSTYMRQVAQIVLLAQIGGFVPAKSATIGVCDRVFTRVGAADNLSRGDSTFMVEMRETASILAKATRRSLVILDEVGRGTSTFDGVSIAWAVAEFLHDAIGARTLFATHYHELVALADSRPRVRNVSVAVREHKGEIVFLRRVVSGGANKSYGIDVARLAGLPKSTIGRARQIMSQLESGSQALGFGSSPQLSLLAPPPPPAAPAARPMSTAASAVVHRLTALDVNRITPLEALQLLAELKTLAGDEI